MVAAAQVLIIKDRVAKYAADLERKLLKEATISERLERCLGQEARLYDSRKTDPYDSDRTWPGLEGRISRGPDSRINPYALRHYVLERDRWENLYIFADKVRSIKKDKKSGRMLIDTEWVDGNIAYAGP